MRTLGPPRGSPTSGAARSSPPTDSELRRGGARIGRGGVAGCTEAIDVLTEYFKRGSESQGTAHELNVQGWQCSTIDNGVTNEVLEGLRQGRADHRGREPLTGGVLRSAAGPT